MRRSALLVAALLAAGCGMAGATDGPTDSPSPELIASGSTLPSQSGTPPAASATPSFDPELGPEPRPAYPEVQAIGIGTLRITTPRPHLARFWLACEWSTSERVQWLYTGGEAAGFPNRPIVLFGEAVSLYAYDLLDGDGNPLGLYLGREGEVAPYRLDPAEPPALAHAQDWTTGSVTFTRFRLDPDAWPGGPLPTPKAIYERPLGGDPAAADLSGSFKWTCGPRPATVPTPGPAGTPEPSHERVELPRATLTSSSGEQRFGVVGCGGGWGRGGVVTDRPACAPDVPVPPFAPELPLALAVSAGESLTVAVPTGYHFESWIYEYVSQSAAELYRGEEPPGFVVADREPLTSAAAVTTDTPPAGDWMVRFTYSATNGDTVVDGWVEYFRVDVR